MSVKLTKSKQQMSQTQSNFPTKTRSKTTSLCLQGSSSTPNKEKIYKPSNISTRDAEEMVAYTPLEIGTRGTVGSLVMKEIEYFSQLELGSQGNSKKTLSHVADISCSYSHSRPTFGSALATQKKKKRGSRHLPSMCSTIEVSDINQPTGTYTFSYRNLKSDVEKLQA
ncbi:uncharacterized protein LOC112491197 [Ziziphus jujuba]|uniref:Uncharacterized protein LOC112491197 n=1 Tax=Ziziphus jujuba TaxID=326968 RepID=A0A6P6G2W7_ZIZJJ|nr:uncharacterized protein LOC112491197 [Ziziphus jujuba]